MFCKNCGIQLNDNAGFCPACGTPVKKPATQPQQSYQQSEQNQQQELNVDSTYRVRPPLPTQDQSQQGFRPQQDQALFEPQGDFDGDHTCRVRPPQPVHNQPVQNQSQQDIDHTYRVANPQQEASYQTQQQTYQPQQQATASLLKQKMGWFKFLINFALFASAIVCIGEAINRVTGFINPELTKEILELAPEFQNVDYIVAALYLASAVLSVYARFRLSGYCKNGPIMLYCVYGFSAVIGLVDSFVKYILCPPEITVDIVPSIIGSIVTIVVIILNVKYFNNRKHLFVN